MSSSKVLVLGSGGREHALCWHLKKFGHTVECAPGSDAIAEIATIFDFKDFDDLIKKIEERKIDEVIVGPEKYLAQGVSDALIKKNINVFGPTKTAALLESDKAFAKAFLLRHKIPTARAATLTFKDDVGAALKDFTPPFVIKASGLAAGKGVWIGSDAKEGIEFAKDALKSHPSVVIEEYLKGEEVSYFVLVDGERSLFLGAAQDHKRLLENDEGPNTGGMGAYSPVPILTEDLKDKIQKRVVGPTIDGLKKDGVYFRGYLFVGLMVVNNEPYVLEYNCRLGDPETQSLMMRLQVSMSDLIESLNKGTEIQKELLKDGVSLNVVVAAKGYPDSPAQGFPLPGIDKFPKDIFVFHSGTKKSKENWIANGGRLFSVTTHQDSLLNCQNSIYSWIESLTFLKDVTYRKDIGVKAYRHFMNQPKGVQRA